MNFPLTIRKGNISDSTRLSAFGAQAFWDSFSEKNTPENMAVYIAAAFRPEIQAREISQPGSWFFIAEISDEIVGYTHLTKEPVPVSTQSTRPIELRRIYARKDFVGRGIGKVLMQASLEEAQRLGCDLIWLGVWEHNLHAISFYKKWGFSVIGEHSFQLGDDLQRDLLMAKILD